MGERERKYELFIFVFNGVKRQTTNFLNFVVWREALEKKF